ncbi:MAG: rhomboid family intramembrane serine protease [Rikenellaceae bacterium]|nr:rhomboid family intramembrane serine protease [Rikenellaceae bacterium]
MNIGSGALRTPPVVKNLIIINALVFFAQMILPNGLGNWLTVKGALFFWESDYFQPYQFVTHMFLHGSTGHLFLNMFSLWMFGRILKQDLGSKRFLTFYIICGIGAGLLYSCANWLEITMMRESMDAYMNPAIQRAVNTPSLGASGAIFGVLLGFGMMHPNSVIMLLIPPIPMKAKYFVIIFMVLELIQGFTITDNVAHFAHVGGMVWGFILLKYWKAKGKIYY